MRFSQTANNHLVESEETRMVRRTARLVECQFSITFPQCQYMLLSEILLPTPKFCTEISAIAVTLCNSDDSKPLVMVGMMMRGQWLSSLTPVEVDTSICKIASAH